MEHPQDTSLRQTFDQVKQKQQELDNLDPQSAAFKHVLQSAIQSLERCQKLIVDLSVFSPNEELEDVSTQNMQYLTVEYLLAELLLKSYDHNRLASLRRSSRLLESFLERLYQYSMISTSDRKLFERFQENRSNFSLLSTSNAEERRKVKISRFQEEKQLKKKLEVSYARKCFWSVLTRVSVSTNTIGRRQRR
jgi:immunoglobulin-binding protein 1